MTDVVWDPGGDAHQALVTAVSEQGLGALSSPSRLDNLLRDLLPDLPREASLLVAAAEVNMAGMLRDRIESGVDPGTAVRLSAATLGQGRPFDPSACQWVAREFAMALGLEVGTEAEGGWPTGPTPNPAIPRRDGDGQPLPQWPTPPASPAVSSAAPPTPGAPTPGAASRDTAPAVVLGSAAESGTLPLKPEPEAADVQHDRGGGLVYPAGDGVSRWDSGAGQGPVAQSPQGPPPSRQPPPSTPDRGGPPPRGGSRRPLIIAMIVVVALIVVIGGGVTAVELTGNKAASTTTTTAPAPTRTTATTAPSTGLGTSTTESTSVTTSTASTSTVPPTPAGLTAIAGYLAQSATARTEVSVAEQGVQNCKEDPATALTSIKAGLAVRQGIATNLRTVDVSTVPGGAPLLANLTAAINDSVAADQAFVSWVMDVQTANAQGAQGGQGQPSPCSQYMTDTNWQAANAASIRATSAKTNFVGQWNPLAGMYGLTQYPSDGF